VQTHVGYRANQRLRRDVCGVEDVVEARAVRNLGIRCSGEGSDW
jgi:hypothetical protein